VALISGENEAVYPCPHCKGRLKIVTQYYLDGGNSSHLSHINENGEETDLEEV